MEAFLTGDIFGMYFQSTIGIVAFGIITFFFMALFMNENHYLNDISPIECICLLILMGIVEYVSIFTIWE